MIDHIDEIFVAQTSEDLNNLPEGLLFEVIISQSLRNCNFVNTDAILVIPITYENSLSLL